jgi:hypothetical protein
MQTGRRSFLKFITGAVAGLTMSGKLKALENEKAKKYEDTFKVNSLKENIYKKNYNLSGHYCITGFVPPNKQESYTKMIVSG